MLPGGLMPSTLSEEVGVRNRVMTNTKEDPLNTISMGWGITDSMLTNDIFTASKLTDLTEDLTDAEEVHLVPHYNKHGKGVTKETVEDAVLETAVVGIKTTDKHVAVKDWAARQKYRETTLKTTTRPPQQGGDPH
jgi:hypothetical protein